jgi:hypothetical protein
MPAPHAAGRLNAPFPVHGTKRLIDLFFRLLELLVVVALVAMVIMVFGNVVLRYGFNSGITMSDEMSRYCFIWLTYIGAMIAMREKGSPGRGHAGQAPAGGRQEGLPVPQRVADAVRATACSCWVPGRCTNCR